MVLNRDASGSAATSHNPESYMMTYGYKKELSEGSLKPPIFLTSSFAFKSAEEGKNFFQLAYGLRNKEDDEELGLIYSRINNPNLEILEDRLSLWDTAQGSAAFESGMSAISTIMLEYLKPGDMILYTNPTYGGTDHFVKNYLPSIGVKAIPVYSYETMEDIESKVAEHGCQEDLKLIFIETPTNPTNDLHDIRQFCKLRDSLNRAFDINAKVVVDNTFMGPVWSKPLELGADMTVYSATKYIGGHSDLIAGVVMAKEKSDLVRVKTLRSFLGNMVSPHTAWMLLRSLETLKIRMDRQQDSAMKIANYLDGHEKVERVSYLGTLQKGTPQYEIYKSQYSGPGAMISFWVKGNEAEAFRFLNNLKLCSLAVSLGSTETLVQHPSTMTHAALDADFKIQMNITDSLVRMSVGVEHPDDLIADIERAFTFV